MVNLRIYILLISPFLYSSCVNNNNELRPNAASNDSLANIHKEVRAIKILFGDDIAYFSDTILFVTNSVSGNVYQEGCYKIFLVNKDFFKELTYFNSKLSNDSNSFRNRGFYLITEFSDGSKKLIEVNSKYSSNYFRNIFYLLGKYKTNDEAKRRNIYLILNMLNPIYHIEKPLPENPFELDSFVQLRRLQEKFNLPFVLNDNCYNQ